MKKPDAKPWKTLLPSHFPYLLYKMGIPLLLGLGGGSLRAQVVPMPADTFYRIAFYNAENYFDCLHDSGKNDHDFTPTGIKGWGNAKYIQKRNNLFKVISAINAETPLVALGMAEIENARVLRDLCRGTPLRYRNFDFVHFESNDPRGIDVALLYRTDLLRIDTAYPYPLVMPPDTVSRTRDILYVRALPQHGVRLPDTLHLLVNHFPSKYGGVLKTEAKRAAAALLLRQVLDDLQVRHPDAFILAMGDFNTTPDDPALRRLDSVPFVNLMHAESWKGKTGSHKYREEWSTIDHIYVNHNCFGNIRQGRAFLFDREFLLMPDERYLGNKPFRTFYGARYLGGYSDHLPVYIDVKIP